jgi:hypothetical protein
MTARGIENRRELDALVHRLWVRRFPDEQAAYRSAEFRALTRYCRDRYCGPGKSAEVVGDEKFDYDAQSREIENCLRFLGAPWHPGVHPAPRMVARVIHDRYTVPTLESFILVPLDLIDGVATVRFGDSIIREFTLKEFASFVGADGLRRFGDRFVPDVDRLHQLTWLVLRREEPALFQRARTFLNIDLWRVGMVEPLPRVFAPDVERALFLLALFPWEQYFAHQSTPWQPFRIPWTYSVHRDAFAFPASSPKFEALSWTLAGNPDEEVFEVPAVMHYFESRDRPKLQTFCAKWSRLVSRVAPLSGQPLQGFNPLVEHFFLRAFLEPNIDQLLWHVTAVEAALGNGSTHSAAKISHRIHVLTGDGRLAMDFRNVHYRRRSQFVHGMHLSDKELWQSDLAAARKTARLVIAKLIEFVAARPGWSREQILGFLNSQKTT